MPGPRCAVEGCNAEYSAYKTANIPISFHKFPKAIDFVSQTILNEWIRRCENENKIDPLKAHVCSKHFTFTDYERDMQNELLGLPTKKILKKTAVPNQNIVKTTSATQESFPPTDVHIVKTTSVTQESFPPADVHDRINYKDKYMELLSKYNSLEAKVSTHKNKCSTWQKNTTNTIKKLQSLVLYYKSHRRNILVERSEIGNNFLKTVFTKNQINLLLKKKKQVRWTSEEMGVAFTLRYYSKKCYVYLRNKLNYPLPSLSSLKRWASRLTVGRGYLRDIFSLLELHGEDLSAFEKVVVLQFDEIKLKTILEYDIANDEVLGPYKQMQVVMVCGLFSNWKQPVFIDFDKKVTKIILLNIIKELYKISYNVVACVSDCGGGNVGLWKELEVDTVKTFFSHPVSGKNIYMFADAPHLLKLVRNWLLDTGFQLDTNTTITKKPLVNLIEITNAEVNSCWKISEKHIFCEKSQRQNVKLAAQVLSNTVGTALLQYKNRLGFNTVECENLGHFILDINQWFDIFNSYTEEGTVPSKNGYGRSLKTQNKHLNKITKLISNMLPIGKNTLQTFQKGMIMSIESLKMLFKDMKEEFKISYICTHKLNQDSLENFFFQVRSRGPNEHPSPLIALSRIRMIILGKNPGVLEATVNTKSEIEEEYVVAQVMNKARIFIPSEKEAEEQILQPHTSGSSTSFSSVSSSSINNSDYNLGETYGDAMEYIAGYIAFVFKKDYPQLGDHTYKLKSDHSYTLPSWVQHLSYGGLIKPTPNWLLTVKKWDRYFRKYHTDGSLRAGPGVVHKLALKIANNEKIFPFKIIKHFCKLRTIIRINFINIKNDSLKKQKSLKRKAKEDLNDSERKSSRKLAKVTN